MKKIKWILVLFLISCEDVITIDLPANASLIVVEGWITNSLEQQKIRISRTQNFNEPSSDLFVTDANVSVTLLDSSNTTFSYSLSADGSYRSDSTFSGVVRQFYSVQIILSEGDTINSPFQSMPSPVEIQEIIFDSFEERSLDDANVLIDVYFPIVFSQDPAERRNFYRYVMARNDTIFNTPQDIELLDDSAINGNLFPNEFRTFRYDFGDIASIELRSLNSGAFEFFKLLKSQTTSLGTSSGTSPASINGNLRNRSNPSQEVLGYFGCYSTVTFEKELTR